MERMITFDCMFLECGRKFNTEDLLEEHVKRRHPDYYKDRYAYKLKENSGSQIKKSNKILDDLENKIKEIENNSILLNDKDDNEIDFNIPNMENLELYNEEADDGDELEDEDDVITDEMLLIGGKYFQYEDVDEIELEGRGLREFKNNQDVDFSELTNVLSINLSKNLLRSLDDLKFFSKILILDISKNQIEDIFFVEELTSLNIFYAENNKISSISSLVKCKNLEKLYLANNTIKYQMSSLKTLNSLQKLSELSIKNNTFLENTIGYKYMIIRKCRKLAKLDNEEITAVDRDVAKNYENMNNSDMRPNTSVGIPKYTNKIEELFPSEAQENSDDNLKNQGEELNDKLNAKLDENTEEVQTNINKDTYPTTKEIENIKANEVHRDTISNSASKTIADKKKVSKIQTISNFAVKDKVISQVEYIPKNNAPNNNKKAAEDSKLSKKPATKLNKKSEIIGKNQAKSLTETENDPVMKLNKINLKENPYKKIDQLEKEIGELKTKNSKLIEEKKNIEVSTNLLKSQLENMDKLNKEYEEIIESLKIELEKEKQISKSAIEEKRNYTSQQQQQKDLVSTDDEEKTKLKEQLNILRKDYYDLLYEYSNSKVEAKAAKMGMTSMEFVESQRPKSAIKKPVDDEYDKTVKELKDLRESQINFFNRKNPLDDDINIERESEKKKIIGDLLKEDNGEEAANNLDKEDDLSDEEENFELNHSSNFVNKSIKLNVNQLKESYKPKNDLIEFEGDEEASEDSDLDSIEELFRKSCMGLKELTSEIQTLNHQTNPELNPQMRKERSKSKNPNKADKTAANPYIQNPNLNKLNRLKSKEKILINEEDITNRENITSKKPSSAEELIKEAEREKNKITSIPIISDKTIKRPIVFPSAGGSLGKIGGPKLIVKKDQEQNSFISNNNNSIIEDNLDKKPSNKIVFKPTSLASNPLKPIENKISPNSTLSQMKQNLNNNSNLDLNSNNPGNPKNILGSGINIQKNVLINKPSLNGSNPNTTINSGKVNFNSKINLSNFNNTETEKTTNTSSITQNSSNDINLDAENLINTSSGNNNPKSFLKNFNTSHLRSNSNLSSDSANLILNNIASNGFNKNKDHESSNLNKHDNLGLTSEEANFNKHKINSNSSDKEFVNSEVPNLNSERVGLSKNLHKENILINNKINDVSNIRNNISLKKPAIMGAAYGNSSNSKPLLKTKTETMSNKKLDDINLVKK